MPTYDYRCPKCDTLFEVIQRMKDRPGAPCPKCGAKAVRQLSGGHSLHFKGSGFYITDYKHKEDKSRKAEGDSARPAADSSKHSADGPKPEGAKQPPKSSDASGGSSGTKSGSGSSD